MFATAFIPRDVPNYWEIIARFGCLHSSDQLTPQSVCTAMETLQFINPSAFCMDMELTSELVNMKYEEDKPIFGIPLTTMCQLCGSKLLLRGDRPSRITLYTSNLGTIPGTHYHKYCSKYRSGCKFVQYYGYSKSGGDGYAKYDAHWMSLPYFISSQETGFELALLKNFDALDRSLTNRKLIYTMSPIVMIQQEKFVQRLSVQKKILGKKNICMGKLSKCHKGGQVT